MNTAEVAKLDVVAYIALVPEISRFFGMVIAMYYNDHSPPHFHVRYGAQKAVVSIDGLVVIEGALSSRALSW